VHPSLLPGLLTALVPLTAAAPAIAQLPRPRSADYLTVAGVDDVRAAWVNPAGLARVLEASIMAEVVVDRLPDATLAQYTLGMNSRGFSVSFARDRTVETAPVNMTRFGVGLPFQRGSLGVGVTLFRASARDEGVDLGLDYRLTRALDVAAVVRHLGRPVVRGAPTPVTALAGLQWRAVPRLLILDGELAAADAGNGLLGDIQYRGMLRFSPPGRSRIEVLTGVELVAHQVERVVIGVGLGTTGWVGAVGGASRSLGLSRPDRFSLTGVKSHRALGVAR